MKKTEQQLSKSTTEQQAVFKIIVHVIAVLSVKQHTPLLLKPLL